MRTLAFALLLAFPLLLTGCVQNAIDDPSFDLWCGKKLCYWQLDEGQIAQVGTWHREDSAVSFLANPTQISQLQESSEVGCLKFEMIADVELSARTFLRLDFGDDGIVDFEQLIPQASWAKLSFEVPTPRDYERVRYILEKQGEGRAVLAHLRVRYDSSCRVAPLELPDGSSCRMNTTCASGLCGNGQCFRCPAQGCGEGESCASDAQCTAGSCVAGRCRACGAQQACPALSACQHDEQCASGRCLLGLVPSRLEREEFPRVCGECARDSDCQSGFCVHGMCAACVTDGDCPADVVCRYSDDYDTTERTCLPALETPRARGALCERAEDCADGLRCGGTSSLAARCGGACESGLDCLLTEGWFCLSAGTTAWLRRAGDPAPDWSEIQTRVHTCFAK